MDNSYCPQNYYSHSLYHDHRTSDYNLWLSVDNFHYPDLHLNQQEAIPDTTTHPDSSQSSPVSIPTSLHPSVKVEEPEDPDGCFIMELSSMSPSLALSVTGMNPSSSSLAPPTEVPLRATQASKEMRKMMGVFRLNPFAMHSGEGRGVMPALWGGGGPLEEEPLIFEFQLDIEDGGDSQFDNLGITSGSSESPTTIDLLGTEDEAQLRSFSPSFELHPEDLRSDMGEEHEQEQEDCITDPDQQNEWSDVDCGNQSEVDTSSTTHSVHTPISETRSAHTPFNESSSVYQYPSITPASVASSCWDIDSYQVHGEEHLPPVEKMEGGHKMHRVHTTSHPYLRRSIVNPHQASPSSSTHSLSQSHPHLHTAHPQQQLNFGYPTLLQHPTTHHHYHNNNNNNNNNHQVPRQNNHNHQQQQQSYSHHPTTTVHDSMISVPVIPVVPSSHRPAENSSMYSSPSSYMRSSGRNLKPAEEDEASALLQHHQQHHHHHPAGIVNEYTPRGTVSSSSNIYTTTTNDTHHYASSGHHHQYEHSSSLGGHVLSPSRRWSLPETIGGPFRSTM